DPREGQPVRLRCVPAPHEGHQLPRHIRPALWGPGHHAQLEYHHRDRQGAGLGAAERRTSSLSGGPPMRLSTPCLAFVIVGFSAQESRRSGVDLKAMAAACKPCDDFWRYVNGGW